MIDDTRLFPRSLAFTLAGFLFFIAIVEALLITYSGGVPPHYNPMVVGFVYLSGFVVNPLLMYFATKYPSFKLFAIVWFHLTVGALMLWFSEIFSPFTPLWSMMILLASIFYGWKGFIGSSLSLCLIGALYISLFNSELSPSVLVYSGQASIVIVMAIVTSYLFVRIIMGSHKKNKDLENAQRSEMLQVNRLNTLLNSISDAVLTLNRYGRVTSQNAAAQVFFDTNQSLIGRDIDKLLQVTDMVNASISIRNLIESIRSTTLRDDLSVGKGGDTRHLSVQMSRIRSTFDDNEEYGVVLIIRDITKQKTLEDEKDEFISVTSHELRTPVAIAEGSLSNLLLMQSRGIAGDKLQESAKTAHTQVIYLAKMINDLSTLSRAERGVGDVVETININEMIHNLYVKYSTEAEEKALQLNIDAETDLPEIESSRLYLEEILQNFITNAIKYTKKGSVTIGVRMESSDYVKFFVKDSGIGIAKTDLAHIFEKFYRSEDYRTRETGGTGLGLYVVEKLAAKLNTHIEVDSRINSGSTFSFVVSLHTNKVASPAKEEAEEVDSTTPETAPELATSTEQK